MLGYTADFITGSVVNVPVAPAAATAQLDYVHFSLVMNPNRQLAWWVVGWNIDGSRLFPEVPRESSFYPEVRIPAEASRTAVGGRGV